MAYRIFSNIASLNAQRHLEVNRNRLDASIGRISTGVRINKAADDSGGLGITSQLNSDTQTLKQGARNLTDGLTLLNVAEGAMNEQAAILVRLRELASQAATATVGQVERGAIQLEFSQLRMEFDRISTTVEFNGVKLLDGTLEATNPQKLELQIGLNSSAGNRINLNQELDLAASNSTTYGFNSATVATQDSALTAMGQLTAAIDQLALGRADIGALQNRLSRARNNLDVSIENLTAASSQIQDTDMAVELTRLTRNQILVQSATAMVGQANLLPQGVFTLIGQV